MKKWYIDNVCFLSTMLLLSSIAICFVTGMISIKTDTATPLQLKIMLVCLGVMVIQMLMGLFHAWLPKWYSCDGMDWHTPDSGYCTRCGKYIDYL